MTDSIPDLGDAEMLSPVISYFDWWDCPRAGVARYQGRPHYFLTEFSETLDDYEDYFALWPLPTAAISLEAEWWGRWSNWRASLDRGETPQPFEHDQEAEHLEEALRDARKPPATALRLRAEWRLDSPRSFDPRVPRHQVCWRPNS